MSSSNNDRNRTDLGASPNAKNPNGPGRPMPEDEIPFQADVWRENGRVIGANFRGQVDAYSRATGLHSRCCQMV